MSPADISERVMGTSFADPDKIDEGDLTRIATLRRRIWPGRLDSNRISIHSARLNPCHPWNQWRLFA